MRKIIKKTFFLQLILFVILSCSSAKDKIQDINSRANIDDLISTSDFDQNRKNYFTKEKLIDSIKNVLMQNKTIDLDIKYKDLITDINFNNLRDTIFLGDIHTKTLSGGIPLVFEYDVNPNDIIYFDINNLSVNKVGKIEILEGDKTRYLFENQSRKDKISSSFSVISGPKISLQISNDNPVKNIGLFKSKLKISLKKISNLIISSNIIADTTIFYKKINKTVYDTIYNLDSNFKFELTSTSNLSDISSINIPIRISKNKNLVAWSYWLGLNRNDSITVNDIRNNPISFYIENELNNKLINKNISAELSSENENIKIYFENFTIDRRGLNFSKNYSMFKVDNYFTSDIKTKASLKLINNSNLYDYSLQFIQISANLVPKIIEIDVVDIDVKEKIRLNLLGL